MNLTKLKEKVEDKVLNLNPYVLTFLSIFGATTALLGLAGLTLYFIIHERGFLAIFSLSALLAVLGTLLSYFENEGIL